MSITQEQVLRVLIVEDSRDQAADILKVLGASGFHTTSRRVQTSAEILAAVESLKWDLVVTAERLSSLSAETVVRLLESSAEPTPCVVISDTVCEGSGLAPAVQTGFVCVPREHLCLLPPTVRQELRMAEIHRETHNLGEKSLHLAWYDRTTGLPGRPLFTDRLQVAITHARSRNARLAVMLLHVACADKGEIEGHPAGEDRLLQAASVTFRRCIRAEDTIGRWGPHEFILLFQDVKRVEEAERIARKLIDVAERPLEIQGHRIGLSGTIGVALYPDHAQGLRTLIGAAAAAMGETRGRGGNRYQLAVPPAPSVMA